MAKNRHSMDGCPLTSSFDREVKKRFDKIFCNSYGNYAISYCRDCIFNIKNLNKAFGQNAKRDDKASKWRF